MGGILHSSYEAKLQNLGNGSRLQYYSVPTAMRLLKPFSELIETVGCIVGSHRNWQHLVKGKTKYRTEG